MLESCVSAFSAAVAAAAGAARASSTAFWVEIACVAVSKAVSTTLSAEANVSCDAATSAVAVSTVTFGSSKASTTAAV